MSEMKQSSRNFIKSFGYAFSGIRDTFKSEYNFKVHLVVTIITLFLGIILSLSVFEWLWVFLAIALVCAAELFNTALEALANFVSPEFHPLIKKSKDAAAAAVLVISILALLIGLFIFIPKLWGFF